MEESRKRETRVIIKRQALGSWPGLDPQASSPLYRARYGPVMGG